MDQLIATPTTTDFAPATTLSGAADRLGDVLVSFGVAAPPPVARPRPG